MTQEVRRKGDVGGMSQVFMSTRLRRIFFWTLIVFLALLTIRDVIALFMEYAENEKEADMNIVFNQTMTFPNFTFCVPMAMVNSIYNSSRFKSKADLGGKVSEAEAVKKTLAKLKTGHDFLSKQWDRHVIHDAIKTIGLLHSLERETDDTFVAREIKLLRQGKKSDQRLKSINFWMQEIAKRNVTFGDFMQKAGSEVLRRMVKRSYRRSPLNNDKYESGFKITWISKGDICFQPTFDEEGSADIEAQGNFYTLFLNHDPDTFEDDIHCMIVDMNGRPADMSRFIDSGGHTKDGVNEELCPGTLNDLIVEVRATYEMLENDDSGTACLDFEDDEDSNEFDCRSRCRMDLIRSICGCSPITTEYLVTGDELDEYPLCDYGKCEVDIQRAAKSEKACTRECKRNCKQLRYSINLVGSKESTVVDAETDEPVKALYQTQVNLAWGSFEYFQLQQNYKYETIVNFFADIGGAIGIWLGLSILTLIQGAAFLVELVAMKVGGKNHEEDEEEEPEEDASTTGAPKKKVSENPLGPTSLSANPFEDFAAPRKRSTASAAEMNKQ